MSSELSLTWDDHHKTLVGVFEELLQTSTLVDCTIAAEGQYIKAHKIILSACSPYFQLLFSQESEKNPIVVLKDIKFQELKAMIDFIYRGKVKVPEERLEDFVDAAESLQIKGLASDSHHKMIPQNTGNKGLEVRRRGQSSPQPCKRLRHTDFGDGVNRGDASSMNVVSFENTSFQGTSYKIPEVTPTLSKNETLLTRGSATTSPTSLPSSACSRTRNLETTESVSLVKTPLPPSEEAHALDSVVVKSEPEPIAEVYISDTECYIEPKEEEIAENVELEQTEPEINSELTMNEFPGMEHACASAEGPLAPVAVGEGQRSGRGRSEGEAAPPLAPPARGAVQPPSAREKRRHRCPTCGKSFQAPSLLARHVRTHTGERPFACGTCGKASRTMCDLRKHLRVHTGAGRAFPSTSAAWDMRAITALWSGGERWNTPRRDGAPPVPPSAAPRRPSSSPDAQHKRPRRHRCGECGKAFTTPSHLLRHFRCHTGERPFTCEQCGKAFSAKDNYQKHLRVHSDERPYSCDQCDYSTIYSWYIAVHKRNVHGTGS